jgi:WD40 repeat protein
LRLPTSDRWSALAFSPDRATLYSASEDGTVRYWDVATGRLVSMLTGRGQFWSLALSADGRTQVTGDSKGTMSFRDVETEQELLAQPAHRAGIRSIAFSPDGSALAALDDGTLRLWKSPRLGDRSAIEP